MKPLTFEQERVFSFIQDSIKKDGAPPTTREIAEHFGYKSVNNARQHVKLIESKGYLRIIPGRARGIELLISEEKDYNESGVDVPLVGSIAAGKPITAIENINSYVTLDKNLFKGKGLFTLRVKGDSMEGIGVLDGDIVVVRQQQTASNGDIVVAIIDDDATLKRYIKEKDRVILRAENPFYEDIIIPADRHVSIAGRMVGVMRKC